MKNNSKRIFALLLAIVMCVSCVVPVFAEVNVHSHAEGSTTELVDKTECQYAIDEKGTHVYVEGAEHLEHVGTEPAKCDAPGYEIYKCTACGTPVLNTSSETFVPGEHEFGEWETIDELTCVQDGSYKRTCTKCGHEETYTEKAGDHKWSDPVVNTDENGNPYVCGDENAYATRTCTVCGETKTEELADKCDFSGRPVFVPGPTCTEKGEAIYTCANCGTTKTVEVLPIDPENGHTWKLVGDYVSAPTCKLDGTGYAVCAVCGIDYVNEETENIYTFVGTRVDEGHNFVEVPAKDPNCTEMGWHAYNACEYCGKVKPGTFVEVIPATGHKDLTFVPATKVDCENDAVAAHYVCACGAYLDADKNVTTKDALIVEKAWGHDFTAEEPTVKEPATCTKYGYELYCCTKCGKLAQIGDSQGVVMLDPLKHTNEDGTSAYVEILNGTADCENGTTAYQECTLCGDKTAEYDVPALDHDYVRTPVAATCASYAYTLVTCSRCAYEAKENIGTEYDENNHDFQTRITTPAGCGEVGVRVKYCANEGCTFVPVSETFTVEHDYQLDDAASVSATCYAEGTNVYKCTKCSDIKSETVDKLAHVWPEAIVEGEFVQIIAPVCGNNGKYILTCTNEGCGETKELAGEAYDRSNPAHHANGVSVPACTNPDHIYYVNEDGTTGTQPCDCDGTHVYRPGNCNTYGLEQYQCSCGVRYYVIMENTGPAVDKDGNKVHYGLIIDAVAKAPTCTEDGNTEGWHCESCGDKVESEKIAKHDVDDWTHHDAVEDTCTVEGNVEYWSCDECNKFFVLDGENYVEVTEAELVVDDIHHVYVYVPEKSATCAKTGVAAYYTCENCDVIFDLEYAEIEEPAELPINDNHLIFSDISYKKADCLNDGFIYHYCPVCGLEYIDSFKYALGHTYDKQEQIDPECDATGTEEHYTCSNKKCDLKFQIVDDEYVVVTDEDLVIDTLNYHKNADGETFYDVCTDTTEDKLCVWCEKDYAGLGHEYIENVVAPTCENDGYTVQICIYCAKHNADKAEIVKATGHKPEMVLGKAATPTEDGYKVYQCACGQYFNKDAEGNDVKVATLEEALIEVIPATGAISFTYTIDNAIYSGAEFVNGGRIKLTINYEAVNVDLASIAIRLNYNKNVLTFVSGNFVCDAQDEAGRVFNIDDAAIGGNTPGFVVVTANTFAFGETPADKTLTGEGVFAEIYFDINKNVVAGSEFGFVVDTTADLSATKILSVSGNEVNADFGTGTDVKVTKALGDIDIDDKYTVDDELEFLTLAATDDYIAAADIDQDGWIDADDYQLLRDLLLGNKTYAEMCEAAQK